MIVITALAFQQLQSMLTNKAVNSAYEECGESAGQKKVDTGFASLWKLGEPRETTRFCGLPRNDHATRSEFCNCLLKFGCMSAERRL